MTNSKYVGISFLLYIGSPILYGILGTLLSGQEFFIQFFLTIGLGIAFFSWCIFSLTKTLPATNGKDGLPFCILIFTSFIFLLPAAIISFIIIDSNVVNSSYHNPSSLSSSYKCVWKEKTDFQSNSTVNSDQLKETEITLTNNLPNSNVQNSIENAKIDNGKLKDTFDFGFSVISNEEIRSRFDEIRLHVKQKNAIHTKLAKWIDEQAQIRRTFISYPDIYHKAQEFIDLNM